MKPENEMLGIIKEFDFMHNVHDIIKKKEQEGTLTTDNASRLIRLVRVFNGNDLDLNKKNLEYPNDDACDQAILNAHEKMRALQKLAGKGGEKILRIWNREVFRYYVGAITMRSVSRSQDLKHEIHGVEKNERKKDQTSATKDIATGLSYV